MENIKSTVAKLNCGNTQGTAFLISKNFALTMSHCVQEAIDDNKKIYLSFKNIYGEDEIERIATILEYDNSFPVSILKIDNKIDNINPLEIKCFNNQLTRGTRVLTYGYPKVKGEEGSFVDLSIDDYLHENVENDADITLKISADNRMQNYSGMSGSPVIYKNGIIGILTEQTNELSNFENKAIALKMISMKKVRKMLDAFNINYIEKGNDTVQSYLEDNVYGEGKRKFFKEHFIIESVDSGGVLEDYEKLIDNDLNDIILIKNKGNIKKAWEKIDEMIAGVRGSNSKSPKILARLYYQKACWYIDDYEDCKNAQRYIRKVLKINKDFDCRNYNAKKCIIKGKFSEAKEILNPIDNVFVLNTYLQVCTYSADVDDAFGAFEKNKCFANETTYYLMSLIAILDEDYQLAHRYLYKSNEVNKDFPLHIMMEGVIKYWEILPSNMIYGGDLLPPMYVNSIILLNNELKQKMKEIGCLYEKAYNLACSQENIQLQKQILSICLNTFSISDDYRENCYEIADKLMELENYQCQAVIYYCATGRKIPLKENFNPEEIVQKKGKNIGTMISCIYLYINKGDKVTAYGKLREYRFKFDETHMMSYWFELLIRCCDDQETLRKEQAKLDDFEMDKADKERIDGMFLNALGENEKLINHELMLYEETNSEIDLINLINCYERNKDWENVEFYSRKWKQSFCNLMANIKIIRSLALQNKQEECLNVIHEIRKNNQDECLTNEVLFYEVQSLELLGKYDEAIEKGNILRNRETNYKILILLSECYYLNMQEEQARFVLWSGIENGIQNVEIYQLYAEYNKDYNNVIAEEYINEALIYSNYDADVMKWAMNFLYSIGKSDKASELLFELKSFGKIEGMREISFKEAKELIEQVNKASKERYEKYNRCQMPYHLYIDQSKNSSYTLLNYQLWDRNTTNCHNKQPILTNYGGHNVNLHEMKKTLGKIITIDFSSLIHLKHFELLDEIKYCWNKIIISGNFRRIIALEQNLCSPIQPDVLKAKEKMMNLWKNKSIHYISYPSQKDREKWLETGINFSDIIPYEIAKRDGLVLISDNFVSDLLEESHKISKEMRDSVISVYELLTILEKRGEINEELKNKYKSCNIFRKENKLINALIEQNEKISILVDENFLNEIFKINGVSVISQKCNIFVFDDIFEKIENEIKNAKVAKNAFEFLDELKTEIQNLKNEGYIDYYGFYEDVDKRKYEMLTNDLLDLIHYVSSKSQVVICDDRWLNSYDHMDGCSIFSFIDIIEILHEEGNISDEKYISVITQMFSEGYAYIIPPFEYIRLLIEQISNKKNIYENIPEELSIMCDYLIYITASKNKLNNQIIHPNQLPESVDYMYKLQRVSIKAMEYIWGTERRLLWKNQVSNWLIANYSVFSYQSNLNENIDSINKKYYEIELAGYLSIGFRKVTSDFCGRDYYNWLFNRLDQNTQWKNELEDRVMKITIDMICGMYDYEVDIPDKDVGISMMIYYVIDCMPEYYQKLIRKDEFIKQKMNEIERNLIYLEDGEFVLRKSFNQWIEDVMKQEVGSSIETGNETKKYRITFVSSELFYQLFKIEVFEKNSNKKEKYFKIDQALLSSRDESIRKKGLLSLNRFITKPEIESYLKNIGNENWESLVQDIRTRIISKEDYFIYIVHSFFENETNIFTINDMFSISIEFFRNILENNAKDDLLLKEKQWLQEKNKTTSKLFAHLLIYVYHYLKKNEVYSDFTENDIFIVASYLTNLVMEHIIELNRNKKLKIPLSKCLENFTELNENMGYLDEYKSNYNLNKEKNNYEVEKYFEEIDLKQVTGSDLENICQKIYLYDGKKLQDYLLMIKNWIEDIWKKEDVDERQVLTIMGYFTYIKCKDSPQKVIDVYIGLWNSILEKNKEIHLSMDTMYVLRSIMMSFGLEDGIRMRKIIEKIML